MLKRLRFVRSVAFMSFVLACAMASSQEAPPTVIPPPKVDDSSGSNTLQKAVLAGGCYWGTQGIFQHVKGVKRVVAGFSGGWSDADGAAEAVKMMSKPHVISYGQAPADLLLGGARSDRARSAGAGHRHLLPIRHLLCGPTQRKIAQAYIAQLDGAKVFPARIVTRVDPLSLFHAAVPTQQDFMMKHPDLPYIAVNHRPSSRT